MKNHTCIFILLLVSCFISNSYGQTNTLITEEKPYIELTGTAEKDIVPDEIYITITLKERLVNREKLTVEMQEEKLKSGLKEIGIDISKDLYLADATADYIRVKWRSKDVIEIKEYIVKTTNAAMVTNVFKKLDELDIENAGIQRVSHSKMDSIKRAVRITAIKAAKEKADYLLQAIGEQTAKPLIVRETEAMDNLNLNNLGTRNVYQRSSDYKLSQTDTEQIQFQKIKVRSTVYVKFGIK